MQEKNTQGEKLVVKPQNVNVDFVGIERCIEKRSIVFCKIYMR